MPDQSTAATEHAILQEVTAPLETLPDDPVAAVHADFPVALRGYDRLAVDAYVKQTSQLVAELQATRSPEAAVRRALERVGEQISGILQRAHETAEEITTQSRREGEDRLEHARAEAAEIVAAARERVKDLDADTDRIWVERHRIVDDARELAHQLMALAESAAARFPESEETTEAAEAANAANAQAEPEPESEAAADGEDVTARFQPLYDQGAHDDSHDEPDPASDEQEAEGEPGDAPTSEHEPEARAGGDDREPSARDTRSGSVIPPASDAANRRVDD
jgi:cell division septum initiation protein DivIVA